MLGGGPNRIGQAIEFDYCCVHAAQALRKLGYEAVLVNSNPETVSTDYDTSDRLYLEPLVPRSVLAVCELEQPSASPSPSAARRRCAWRRRSPRPACRCSATRWRRSTRPRTAAGSRSWPPSSAPEWGVAENGDEARAVADRIGYPVLVRPHHVIGGRGMHVAHAAGDLNVDGPCLVDRYLEGALELDVDALCDGEGAWVAAVLEHIEPTGVHSGDSACVLPGPSVSAALEDEIRAVATRIAAGLGARGLINLQLAVTGASCGCSRRIRARRGRCRSSPRRRACPSSSTPCGCCSASVSTRSGLPSGRCRRAPGRRRPSSRPSASPAPPSRGPEMKSTGEVMAGAGSASEAYRRALRAAGRARRGGAVAAPLQAAGEPARALN